ncbi:MAG: hypothetical protein DRI36_00790, partial [Caldiserica bacterium]
MKGIYLDIWSCGSIDIEEFLRNFSFPIKHSEYLDIEKQVTEVIDNLILEMSEPLLRDILIIQYK